MISYVLPTRNRPERLKATLDALAALGNHSECGGAEVIVIDNASDERLILPPTLSSGLPIKYLLRTRNEGAAARNAGAAASDPSSSWIVMLDDDSYPDDTAFLQRLAQQPPDVAAVSADIWLPSRRGQRDSREQGGLPEVFIGCGVAIRRSLFLSLKGYDPSFNYYVEEYDLVARILLAGHRVAFDPTFSVTHAKVSANRDMNLILGRLVRNNSWVAQRYAPDHARLDDLRESRRRYRRIAAKEHALPGYAKGLLDLRRTLRAQQRTPMPDHLWDRFTGLAAAREALQTAYSASPFTSAAVVDSGKNAWVIGRALHDLGVKVTGENDDAETIIIGTMSPGPMLDAFDRRLEARRIGGPRILMPWTIATTPARPVAAAA